MKPPPSKLFITDVAVAEGTGNAIAKEIFQKLKFGLVVEKKVEWSNREEETASIQLSLFCLPFGTVHQPSGHIICENAGRPPNDFDRSFLLFQVFGEMSPPA